MKNKEDKPKLWNAMQCMSGWCHKGMKINPATYFIRMLVEDENDPNKIVYDMVRLYCDDCAFLKIKEIELVSSRRITVLSESLITAGLVR